MVAIAIFSADPVRRRSLEEVLRGDSTITIVGVADDPAAVLRLIDQNHVDAVLADAPTREHLGDETDTVKQPSSSSLTELMRRTASMRSMQGRGPSCLARRSATKSSARSRRSPPALLSCRANCF